MQNGTAKEKVHTNVRKAKPLVIGDKVFRSSNDCELTENDMEKARVDLGETEEKKKKCLSELKKKLSKDTNVNYCTDDAYLLRFLRVRKYDVEKAYQCMKLYYQLKKKNPDLFIIPDLQNQKQVTYLPYCDEDGRLIFWFIAENWKEDETFEVHYQRHTAICGISSMNPTTQINGTIGIWDCKGFNLRLLTESIRKNRLPTIVSIFQNCFPYRKNKVLLLNINRLVRITFNIIRPLLSKKLSERVFLLGSDMQELHEHVNPAILPKALGGELDDDECYVSQRILERVPSLIHERSYI